MRVGSLFSGYGGLELGVQAVLGGSVAWHAETDPGARRILEHRFPGVPNLGDVAAVDWPAVEPVDVLTGGFPCQDVSVAGLRQGMRPDTRSGLWTHFAFGIDQLRPSLVVIENVRGILSASAHSDLEPCPWCLGDDGSVPLRALGAVLGDLADLGYDAAWHGLRAADVGAPHGRFRVFIVAWPAADPGLRRGDARRRLPGDAGTATGGRSHAQPVGCSGPAADTQGDGRHERRAEPARLLGGPHAAERSTPAATDADRDALRPQPVPVPGGGCAPVAGLPGPDAAWGPYELAVRRWERRLGRPAPAPTVPAGRTGNPRLSPVFVEWLMGLPAGWVTDVPGLSRNDQLRALGNGVVPQQAAEALRRLLAG